MMNLANILSYSAQSLLEFATPVTYTIVHKVM